MKALVLAAGFGTRLLPHTDHIPKPLFPVAGRPVMDRIIRALCRAGCQAVVVNTHHLAEEIEAYLRSRHYPIPVSTRREPEILGTGGAIRNLADFWDRAPFMVVNSDIVTDIDLGRVYAEHLRHDDPVTLVLVDCPRTNSVAVSEDGCVSDFDGRGNRRLTFTGIQVADPAVIDWMPPHGYATSIEGYRRMIAAGNRVRAWIAREGYWKDIGTPEGYFEAAADLAAPEAFWQKWGLAPVTPVRRTRLSGDGSDRQWYRLRDSSGRSLILADHGIRPPGTAAAEVDATVSIGRHLKGKGLPVPEIVHADRFAGLVFFEDLGDTSLQSVVRGSRDPERVAGIYQIVVRRLVALSQDGAEGFDPAWAWQGPRYDRALILEKECRYFCRAFLGDYLGIAVDEAALAGDFAHLAAAALAHGISGFMHRDLQSRNIMIGGDGRPTFIDYQGGRLGPIQYDLASLLIDPYVTLPGRLRDRLVDTCAETLGRRRRVDPIDFRHSFDYCAVCRNLQVLGAFGFLSRVKRKTYFEAYIPTAVDALRQRLTALADPGLARLKAVVDHLPASKYSSPSEARPSAP